MAEQLFQSHFVLKDTLQGDALDFQSPTAQRTERIEDTRARLLGAVTGLVPFFLADYLEYKPPVEPIPNVMMSPQMRTGFLTLSASVTHLNFNDTFKGAGFRSKEEVYRKCLEWTGKLMVLAGYQRHGMLDEADGEQLARDIGNTITMLNETSDINGFFPFPALSGSTTEEQSVDIEAVKRGIQNDANLSDTEKASLLNAMEEFNEDDPSEGE